MTHTTKTPLAVQAIKNSAYSTTEVDMTLKPTVDQLLQAIHEASSLSELKQWLGPSNEELKLSRERIDKLHSLWLQSTSEGWGDDPESWPSPFNEAFRRLATEQTVFENMYL